MTTLVTVKASGPNYPARVIKWATCPATEANPSGHVLEADVMVASGFSYDMWVGPGQTIVVTEEYHAEGFPPAPQPTT